MKLTHQVVLNLVVVREEDFGNFQDNDGNELSATPDLDGNIMGDRLRGVTANGLVYLASYVQYTPVEDIKQFRYNGQTKEVERQDLLALTETKTKQNNPLLYIIGGVVAGRISKG
jgi:hypothetical protein